VIPSSVASCEEIIMSGGLSFAMKVYVLLKTKPGTSEEVIRSLREKLQKSVVTSDSVFGSWDVILVIEAKDLEEFGEVLYQVIEKNPNTIRTETCVVLPSGE